MNIKNGSQMQITDQIGRIKQAVNSGNNKVISSLISFAGYPGPSDDANYINFNKFETDYYSNGSFSQLYPEPIVSMV